MIIIGFHLLLVDAGQPFLPLCDEPRVRVTILRPLFFSSVVMRVSCISKILSLGFLIG
jgi:hypothetical protein